MSFQPSEEVVLDSAEQEIKTVNSIDLKKLPQDSLVKPEAVLPNLKNVKEPTIEKVAAAIKAAEEKAEKAPRQLASSKKAVKKEKKVSKKKVAKKVVAQSKPKKKAVKKKVVKNKPKKNIKKKAKKKAVSRAVGSKKMQSFFKQRDRKALFYSSLKAETLAVEIQRKYKKLRKNKKAWSRFYSQWRKKVRTSLAKDIRNYPIRSQKYAYPKIIESFKKDYNLFYKYGESFDAKVKGVRTPSGAPRNIQKVFTRYKKQAQSLGR